MRTKGAIINGPMIMEQSKKFAQLLNVDFDPNAGWLTRWKSKENVTFNRLQGECAAANLTGAEEWIANVLLDLLNEFDPSDVYNANETGLLLLYLFGRN